MHFAEKPRRLGRGGEADLALGELVTCRVRNHWYTTAVTHHGQKAHAPETAVSLPRVVSPNYQDNLTVGGACLPPDCGV